MAVCYPGTNHHVRMANPGAKRLGTTEEKFCKQSKLA